MAQELSDLSIGQLIEKLKRSNDDVEKRKIRATLRRKGHSGGAGLKTGRASAKKKVVKKGKVKGKRARQSAPVAVPV